MKRRRPGRPVRAAVTREQILQGALDLLEERGLAGTTMRELARRLGVDPMTLYHYVADRDVLLREAAAMAYTGLTPRPSRTWRGEVTALGLAYLDLLGRSGELLRYITARSDAARAPTLAVRQRFTAAIAPLALSKAQERTAHDVFVDFVHGFSLGLRGPISASSRRMFRAELAIVLMGIEALAAR